MMRCVLAAVLCANLLGHAPAGAQTDLCQDAGPLPMGAVQASLFAAHNDGSCACEGSRRDVWYRFTPDSAGVLVLDSCGSPNTSVSIHTDCPGTAANQIACNFGDTYGCFGGPHLEATLSRGRTYFIRIASNANSFPFTTYFLPLKAAGGVGPDIVSGDIYEVRYYGRSADESFTAYAMGTAACNIGTEPAIWTNVNASNHHPVISTSLYRLKNGRLEQLGYSWLKHGWAAGAETYCDYCPRDGVFDRLYPGCTDTYDTPQNATQGTLGARSQVNPTTGVFPYPPIAEGSITDATSRRVRVPTAAVSPALNAGARYFAELHYVAADDALAGNSLNNASYREVTIPSATGDPRFVTLTQRTRPAILAWADNDPEVSAIPLDFADGIYTSRLWIAAKAHDNADGTWTYTYAIFNLNANRAAASLTLPAFPGASPASPSFWAPLSHSGEPYSNTPWAWTASDTSFGWSCTQTYAENPSANAIRWGTMYTMSLTSPLPPGSGRARVGLFMPGQPGEPAELGVFLPVPGSSGCPADFNADGFLDFLDVTAFLDCFDTEACTPGISADFNSDGFVDFFDAEAFMDAFIAGC